jgi:hypothetical protein
VVFYRRYTRLSLVILTLLAGKVGLYALAAIFINSRALLMRK